jgi:diguanylate cyclase (GGDEF)-like protein
VNVTIGVITSMALVAMLSAVWLMIRMRRRLFLPLRSITHVMRSLAAGNQESRLPAMKRPDEIGDMARACEVFRVNLVQLEMAHQALQRAEEQAQKLARHDALTGLPNRRVFTANLESTIAFSLPNGRPYSVLLIDLDGFKKVNDLLGHNIGDMVLCEVAQRLRSNIRTQDTVARLGGDEFAVIASDETDLNDHMERMKLLAARLISVIGQDFICEGNVIEMGASIGISYRREGVTDVSNVLHAADIAMYRAKQSGRGAFRFFEQAMDDELRSQEMLERDLMHAIAAQTILPYYQPLVDIQTNRIRGFEALARWKHPIRGFIPPDIFIPFTERLNLMPKLTEAILRQACRDAKNWPGNTCVAVNFPPSAFQDPGLPQWILAILSAEGLPPARLEIEITETALLGDVEGIRDILARLKGLGIAISLDDFGTGYSSLNHLREFKFDKVKIDRSFVQALSGNGDNEKIIDAILGLTKSLGLPAVAEGIENLLVLAQLRSKGCEFGQGFYFAEAVPADAALELLRLDPDDVKSNRFARRLNV